jgi:hypothetical protein
MGITFNQFLSRIDEANISGSRPRPRGRDILTPQERARVSTRRDRTPIQKTGGGVSYISVSPEPKEKPKPIETKPKPIETKPEKYVQTWISGFPAPKDLKVKPYKKIKLNKPEKSKKQPKVRSRQLTLKLKEFVELYRQSITES